MTLSLHKAHICLNDVSKSFGKVSAVSGIILEINRGELFSLLGPSGCGKTTVLRLIAGLERPDSGEIVIDGRTVAGRVWVPPEKRMVGIVFQDYALFPHLTVFKNVAFGLRRYKAEEIEKKVMEMLELVGLVDKAHRYPHELSGGEQQRIALARALAPSPEVLLLDEPFSSLDADLRSELRIETRRIQKEMGITTVLVTHDQQEAFFLSERIGVLRSGRLLQVGRPDEIYHKPANRFVADFVERSDFCQRKNRQWKCCYGKPIHSLRHSAERVPVGSRVRVKVDPAHIVIFPREGAYDD